MHASGHAFLAGAAGILAQGLTSERITLGDERSTWLLELACLGVLAALIKMVGGALSSWAEASVAGEVVARVRLAVLGAVLSRNTLHRARQQDQLAALTTHMHDVERGVGQGVLAEARAAVQLVPLLVLLVVLAPKLAGSAAIALGGFGVLAFGLRRAFKRANENAAASAGALMGAADEAVKHADLWATYGATRRIQAHVSGIGRVIAREAARLRVRASLLSSTSEVLGALALVLTLALASRGAFGVDHGTVVPFAIAFFMAYRPLREIVDARLLRARGEAALAASLVDDTSAIEAPRRSVRWELASLRFDGVRAEHGRHAPLSVEVPAGAIAVVVGPTGIGKTSLFRALLGLEALGEGSVRYGEDLLAGGIGPGERPFAWVPQDAPVVGDTLAINVGLGRADDDAMIDDPAPILAELGAGGLSERLGDGILSKVSGGERQWIAVARALVTGLPVLLLDEPTSALDGAAQARLLEAIARLRGKRTVILVTHRPEPLAIADVVVRMDAGSVPDRDPVPESVPGGGSGSGAGPGPTTRRSLGSAGPQ